MQCSYKDNSDTVVMNSEIIQEQGINYLIPILLNYFIFCKDKTTLKLPTIKKEEKT